MSIWARCLLVVAVITGLTGCDTVIDTQPYLVGKFVGNYQPDTPEGNDPNDPLSFPMTVESNLVSTTATRYTFEGTVSLDGEVYDMTGYEESLSGDLAYLKPQARGVFGTFLMNLQNEAGVIYSACGETLYGSAGGGLPGVTPQEPRLERSLIVSVSTDSWEECYLSRNPIVGTVYELEKK